DWEHAEPEVEVLAQRFVGNRLARIAVRGGDQARVDALFLLAADGQDHALLQNAQEMRLQLDRHLRQLVEEHSASVGALEEAEVAANRAREATLLVTEQLAAREI